MGPADPSRRRVFLAEDHPVTREGLTLLINHQPDLEVCGQAATAPTARAAIQATRPDLAIIDISLAGGDGIELTKDLVALQPRLPILILSTHDESLYAERALLAGARGYVMKHTPTAEVMSAIRQVLQGGLYLTAEMRTKLLHRQLGKRKLASESGMDALTDRELAVFRCLGHGLRTRHIAQQLHVSVSTVETYRAHIKQKLGLQSGTELVRHAVAWLERNPG